MKRKRVKIPPLNARHLIPSTLRIQVFTEQAETALNRAILGQPSGDRVSSPTSEPTGLN